MAGADPKKPELRAASIKGVMRYIWRAAQCSKDMNDLRKREGELFGSANDENTCVSPWRLQVSINNGKLPVSQLALLPYRQGTGRGGKLSTAAIESQTEFTVRIIGGEDKHLSIVHLFVLTCMLGGFGRRSRKGMGTVAIKEIKGAEKDIPTQICDCVNLLNGISETKFSERSGEITPEIADENYPYENYPYIEKIKFHGPYSDKKLPDWLEKMREKIGFTAHEFSRESFSGLARPRFASSLLLTTYSEHNNHYLVITQLHYTDVYDNRNHKYTLDSDKRDEFIAALIG
jgi:CRISPR-associated protein Cmr1